MCDNAGISIPLFAGTLVYPDRIPNWYYPMFTFVLYVNIKACCLYMSILCRPAGSYFFRRHAFEQVTIPEIFSDSFSPGVGGWVPPQLDLACPPKTSSSSHGFLKLLLVGVAFGGCVYMGKKGSGDWFSWTNPYMAFTPGVAQGRSIGRVGTPTELPEVAVPRYQAPSLVQF